MSALQFGDPARKLRADIDFVGFESAVTQTYAGGQLRLRVLPPIDSASSGGEKNGKKPDREPQPPPVPGGTTGTVTGSCLESDDGAGFSCVAAAIFAGRAFVGGFSIDIYPLAAAISSPRTSLFFSAAIWHWSIGRVLSDIKRRAAAGLKRNPSLCPLESISARLASKTDGNLDQRDFPARRHSADSGKFGPNATPDVAVHPLRLVLGKFLAPVSVLLEIAIVLQLALGEYVEGAVIGASWSSIPRSASFTRAAPSRPSRR